YRTETITLGPIGPFKTTAPDNIGLGFWTHQFQGAVYWYPRPDQSLAVMAALTYEINGNQQGFDITPGEHLTLNWGLSKNFPLTSNESLVLEVGPAGYDSWQVTDDTGSNARNPNVHDQVHGVGGQIGVTYAPWNVTLDFSYFYEFYAVDRFQGQSLSINLGFAF
ncbi:MAG TPA: transporter, partial [Verrucomicrobiae bacterium]|nr:transporter [Verrucomicrobiae bacterium]